jgi:hypothetical protein
VEASVALTSFTACSLVILVETCRQLMRVPLLLKVVAGLAGTLAHT